MALRLKELRLSKGISQQELAKITGVPQQTISSVETSERENPGALTLAKLCQALGCTMEEMLGMDAPGKARETTTT